MLKPLLSVSAILLFGITAASAPAPKPQDATPPAAQATAPASKNPVKPTEHSQARAKEIYNVDCSICHGANGDGKTDLAKDMQLTLGDWTDPKTLGAQPDEALFSLIRNGKGKMPSEAAGRANDTEVWNLILYIRAMAKQQPAPPPAPSN
jgi:mono/diheme cytochrome c family protein